jgi:hypothetical protein
MAACPELPQKLVIDGREVSLLQAFDAQILNSVSVFRAHDENKSDAG